MFLPRHPSYVPVCMIDYPLRHGDDRFNGSVDSDIIDTSDIRGGKARRGEAGSSPKFDIISRVISR